ncbi:hypothetical protein QJQ45_027917, partial [Haematococcus lacustris]
ESIRALGFLTTSLCPQSHAAMSSQNLPKVLAHLKRAMQDGDSTVREAAAETLALVAKGLAEQDGGEALGSSSASANPVGKLLLECMSDGKRELQAAACVALGAAAPWLGQVDPPLVKDLIRRMHSGSFQAVPACIQAIARCDPATHAPTGLLKARVVGLVQRPLAQQGIRLLAQPGVGAAVRPMRHSSSGAFQQMIGQLVGQPAPAPSTSTALSPTAQGSGLCGCLASKDWMARKAAADCLAACCLVLGPLAEPEGVWDPADPACLLARAARALEPVKFDKVREVRDTAREASSLLQDLLAYGRSGGSTSGWTAHAAERMAARGVALLPEAPVATPAAAAAAPAKPGPGASPPQGAVRPVTPSRDRPSAFERQGSLADRFRKAHDSQDVTYDPAAMPRVSRSGSAALPGPAQVGSGVGEGPAPPAHHSSSLQHQQQLQGLGRKRSSDGGGPAPHRSSNSGVQLDPTLSSHMAPQLQPSPALSAAQRNPITRSRTSSATSSSDLPGGSRPVARPPSGRGGTRDGLDAMQTITVPLSEWQALQRQLRELEAKQRETADALAALQLSSARSIAELQVAEQLEPHPQPGDLATLLALDC